ncbi:MAG TPA: ACT domain-containing protein [Mycobacteriales bacterium]|nr:ACT domain-containing protein [Mycobacteriales bacterium]
MSATSDTDSLGAGPALDSAALNSAPLDSAALDSAALDSAALDLGPILDPAHLVVARLPVGWRPTAPLAGFSVVIDDGTETTLVCSEDALTAVGGESLEREHGWRRITFAGPLPWEVVGFLADVAGRLAAARIPLAAMAGFTTDHVLVRAAHADLAVAVLRGDPPPPARSGVPS